MANLTDAAENKVVDALYRGQPLGAPATNYFALFTLAPGETGGGTEANYTNYARKALTANLANFSGTQSAGSTTASSGAGGVTSNNVIVDFPAPGSGPQTVVAFGRFDAASSGVLWEYGTLNQSRTLNNGDSAPTFAIGQLSFTVG